MNVRSLKVILESYPDSMPVMVQVGAHGVIHDSRTALEQTIARLPFQTGQVRENYVKSEGGSGTEKALVIEG